MSRIERANSYDMDILLLNIAALLRPIFFIELEAGNLFDLAAILIFMLTMAAFLATSAVRKDIQISSVDLLIVLFSIWCLTAYVVYADKANAREVAKLIIPLWSYIVAKNILRTPNDYRRMLRFLIWGFVIPVSLSVMLILMGKGVELTDYWTGIERWKGAYAGSHSLGHNMVFLLMAITAYIWLSRSETHEVAISRYAMAGLAGLVLAALYCLYYSQVRTATLGLIVFLGIFLFAYNRKLLMILAAAGTIATLAALPVLMPRFFNDFVMVQQGTWDAEEFGSGRPRIWQNNLNIFAAMPIDRQLAGVGIGNKLGLGGEEGIMDSHSDFLDILMQTGIVGLVLFVAIQLLLLKKMLGLPKTEKYLFVAVFVSVGVMNAISNSYVTRFGLAQLFYFLIAYVEVATRRDVANAAHERLPLGITSGTGFR